MIRPTPESNVDIDLPLCILNYLDIRDKGRGGGSQLMFEHPIGGGMELELKRGGQVATVQCVDNVVKCHLLEWSGGMPPRKISKFFTL